MGASDIVPGVSGGTMAFILGVYENLISAIKSFNLEALRMLLDFRIREALDYVSFRFLAALGLGILIAIISLSGFLSGLLDDAQGRILLFGFFFGLVAASILTIGIKVKWRASSVAAWLIGTVFAFVVVNAVPTEGEHSAPVLIGSGMIAITAMILPGISGSFMLLILGQYDYVLTAVSNRDLPPVIYVGIGAVIGIIAFSRVLSYLLARYYHLTVALLVGFMVGSLWKIYPWRVCLQRDIDRHGDPRCLADAPIAPDPASETFWFALALLIAGFLLVNLLDHAQSKSNPVFRLIWK